MNYVTDAVIGKFYRVPCIKTRPRAALTWSESLWRGEWIPIVGPLHEDAEFINFPHLHWHVDFRFVSERVYKRMTHYGYVSPYAITLQKHPVIRGPESPLSDTKETFVESLQTTMRRVKCKREFLAYPYQSATWLKRLGESLAHCTVKNGLCPHRGLPLIGPRDGDVVTCPGHGLQFNIVTGKIVLRP